MKTVYYEYSLAALTSSQVTIFWGGFSSRNQLKFEIAEWVSLNYPKSGRIVLDPMNRWDWHVRFDLDTNNKALLHFKLTWNDRLNMER